MIPLTILAAEIYTEMGEYLNLSEKREATKQYILNEISQWKISSMEQSGNYFFKPIEFKGNKNSPPFEIRLLRSKALEGYHELKFGNLNATDDETRFKWDNKDPYRLQKALFLKRVLESNIKSLFDKGSITGIMFQPYDGDGLADDRYTYFYNMYTKLGKDKYDLDVGEFETQGTYFVTSKV